jgi:hypothetical protein
VEGKEERGNRPEAQQSRVEDDIAFLTPHVAISASCSQNRF